MSGALSEGSPLDRQARAAGYDPEFAAKLARHLNDPQLHIQQLNDFKEYMVQYQALNQVPIPISQIIGFDQFTVQGPELIGTAEGTSSTSYTDLATVGPELSGLPDGLYLFVFGALAETSEAVAGARMSLKYNSTEASDTDAAATFTIDPVSITRAVSKRLANGGNNTVTSRYRSELAKTGSFSVRWLIGLRISS